jgi:hypothetical protein
MKSSKNKIYWFEGVTEKGVRSLLTDENSKFRWLRSQRNRRILVVFMTFGFLLVALGSYYPTLKTNFGLSEVSEILIFSTSVIFVLLSVVLGYSLLRVSVRGIADAPDELLDERQVFVRNTSFRYAYYIMGYAVLALMLLVTIGPEIKFFQPTGNDASYLIIATLFAFSSLPSMVLAWRERDI